MQLHTLSQMFMWQTESHDMHVRNIIVTQIDKVRDQILFMRIQYQSPTHQSIGLSVTGEFYHSG